MSILFAGTSLADFILTGTPTASTTAANINTEALEGVVCQNNRAIELRLPEKQNDIWIGFHHRETGSGTITYPSIYEQVGFYDLDYSGSVAVAQIGSYQPYAGVAATTLHMLDDALARNNVKVSAKNLFTDTLQRVDIHLYRHATEGVFELFIDGVSMAKFVGDTANGGGGINRIKLGKADSGGSTNVTYSGIIVANEDTRGMNFVAMGAIGSGANSGWTGAYTAIDETGYSDSDQITAATADLISTFNFGDVPAKYATATFRAVAVSGRGFGAAPTKLQGALRTGGNDFAKDPSMGSPATMGPFNVVWQVNPNTSAPWTYAEINAAEFGVKSAAA